MKWLCYLSQMIVAKDGESLMEGQIELPFVPFVGLFIVGGDDKADFTVRSVWWHKEHECFELLGKLSTPDGCNCQPGEDCCTLDRELEFYKESGFKVITEDRGYDRTHRYEWMWEPEKWRGADPKRKSLEVPG